MSHYNAQDCETYTLYDIDAVCMPTWQQAKYVCEYYGQELAPWDAAASKSEWFPRDASRSSKLHGQAGKSLLLTA